MPAAYTGELGLRLTVSLRYKAAAVASTAGVAWIHEHHGDACKLRLVFDKLPKLTETPIVLSRTLPFANRHPVTDPGQVFQDQRGLRVFGELNETFGDAVVHPALEAPLSTRHFLEATLGTFGAC